MQNISGKKNKAFSFFPNTGDAGESGIGNKLNCNFNGIFQPSTVIFCVYISTKRSSIEVSSCSFFHSQLKFCSHFNVSELKCCWRWDDQTYFSLICVKPICCFSKKIITIFFFFSPNKNNSFAGCFCLMWLLLILYDISQNSKIKQNNSWSKLMEKMNGAKFKGIM